MIKSSKLLLATTFLGLYFLSTGISWLVFSKFLPASVQDKISTLDGLAGVRSKIDPGLPKTEVCPLNGKKFTTVEKNIWEARRPIAAMIENHVDSRPPSGLSKADVVYEIVAEGGITRFMGLFYCGSSAEDVLVAPVRSARIYFINIAAEYGDRPLFVHVGGANNLCGDCPGGVKFAGQVAKEVRAIEELMKLGWRQARGNDFDTTFDIGYPVLWRNYERLDHEVATEHTMMASTDKIYEEATKRGFEYKKDSVAWDKNFTSWNFTDDAPVQDAKTSISFEFWSNKADYDVSWSYDRANNVYLRSNGGKSHTDLNNGEQLSAKNVVIQFLAEKGPVDKEFHMFYQTIGQGKALIFQNGGVIEGTWKKVSQLERTKFFDKSGDEISFVRGTIWIEGLPSDNEVSY